MLARRGLPLHQSGNNPGQDRISWTFLQVSFTSGEAEHRQEGCGSDDVSAGTRITGPGPVCGHRGEEFISNHASERVG